MSKFTRELCDQLGVEQGMSTAYHPQTDGQSERANQQVEQYLQIYGNTHQNDWPTLLPLAQFIHNTWPNATIKQIPYDLLLGFTPRVQVYKQDLGVPELG